MRRLFEGGAYSSNYCNWQLKSLLHLGQNVITFRTLVHLGPFITFRPSTYVTVFNNRSHKGFIYACSLNLAKQVRRLRRRKFRVLFALVVISFT